jgi:hypothetical protein
MIWAMRALPSVMHAARSPWSLPVAMGVMALPMAATLLAAAFELSEPGESPLWIIVAAWWLVAPLVAAWAALHSVSPTVARRLVAIALFGFLFVILRVTVPTPTQAGVYLGGWSTFSLALKAAWTALGWSVGVARASGWLRRGRVFPALVSGAVWLTAIAAFGFYFGSPF